MLFVIGDNKLEQCNQFWRHKEIEIEKLIISTISDESSILNEYIFGEALFFVNNQIVTSDKKRTDIVALDKNGNVVIIELKKDEGKLGVEMQALQYLSSLSQYKGKDFIKEYCNSYDEDDIEQFLNDGVSIDDINQHSRIILIARYFDSALFSMGKWLCDQGISFKCIAYETLLVGDNKLLNFSVVFDQAAFSSQFKLQFSKEKREKSTYWHNIGSDNQDWWRYLVDNGLITASFDNQPGDRGEEILRNYQIGDTVLAYISKKGCVGYGEIIDLKYELIENGSKDDVCPTPGHHLHRKTIKWLYFLNVDKAIPTTQFEKEYQVPHPIQTSSRIKRGNIKGLVDKIKVIAI